MYPVALSLPLLTGAAAASDRRFPRRYRSGELLAPVGEEMFMSGEGEGILIVDKGRSGVLPAVSWGCRVGRAESSLEMWMAGPAAEWWLFTEWEEEFPA